MNKKSNLMKDGIMDSDKIDIYVSILLPIALQIRQRSLPNETFRCKTQYYTRFTRQWLFQQTFENPWKFQKIRKNPSKFQEMLENPGHFQKISESSRKSEEVTKQFKKSRI